MKKLRLNNQIIEILNGRQFTTQAENTHNQLYIKCNELYECYGSYSHAKINAFNYCIDILNSLKECKNISILNYGISSKNIFQFTYVINALFNDSIISFYITRDNNKIIADKKTIETLLNTLKYKFNGYNNIYYLD